MFEVAQIINQRPIGRIPNDPNDGSYLCPNDLILGRSSTAVPQGLFHRTVTAYQRLKFIQSLVDAFWKRWAREVFPALVVQHKWHVEHRNVAVGDVVIIQDSNTIRGEWTKGLISKVIPSQDGKVRKVEVTYKRNSTSITVERPVQRLIVLVPVEENP